MEDQKRAREDEHGEESALPPLKKHCPEPTSSIEGGKEQSPEGLSSQCDANNQDTYANEAKLANDAEMQLQLELDGRNTNQSSGEDYSSEFFRNEQFLGENSVLLPARAESVFGKNDTLEGAVGSQDEELNRTEETENASNNSSESYTENQPVLGSSSGVNPSAEIQDTLKGVSEVQVENIKHDEDTADIGENITTVKDTDTNPGSSAVAENSATSNSIDTNLGCSPSDSHVSPTKLANNGPSSGLNQPDLLEGNAEDVSKFGHQDFLSVDYKENENTILAPIDGQAAMSLQDLESSNVLAESVEPSTTEKVSVNEEVANFQADASVTEKMAVSDKVSFTEKMPVTDEMAVTDKVANIQSEGPVTEKVANFQADASVTEKMAVTDEMAVTDKVSFTDKMPVTDKVAVTDNISVTDKVAVDLTGDEDEDFIQEPEIPVMWKLPPPTKKFPSYSAKDATVYIILSAVDPTYKYKLHCSKLASVFYKFKEWLQEKVLEADQELVNSMLGDMENPVLFRLLRTDGRDEWELKRQPFTVMKNSIPKYGKPPRSLLKIYDNLFRAIAMGDANPDDFSKLKLAECWQLLGIAQKHGDKCVHLARNVIRHAFSERPDDDLLVKAKEDPPLMLLFAEIIRDSDLYQEAMIHIVGQLPLIDKLSAWKWKTSGKMLCEQTWSLIDEKVQQLHDRMDSAHRELADSGIMLDGIRATFDSADPGLFDAAVIQAIWRDFFILGYKNTPQDKLGDFYHRIVEDRHPYLWAENVKYRVRHFHGRDFGSWNNIEQDLDIMRGYATDKLEDLVADNSLLELKEHGITWVTCTKVTDDEFLWVLNKPKSPLRR